MKIQLSEHFTYKKLLRFVLPSIIMMIFTSIYSVVDGLFVSNFVGKTALAAINLTLPIIMGLSALGFMIGTGGSAIVARMLGEKKREKANEYFSMLIYVTAIGGILLSILGAIFIPAIASMLGAKGQLLSNCILYARLSFISMPAFMLQNVFQSFFVTAEKPHLGLYVVIAAGVTNMVLDFLFVGILGFGLAGAALATVCGEFIGGLFPIFYFTMYINFIFLAIFFGYSIGSAPVISYHYGAGNQDELKNLFRKSLRLIGTWGIMLALLSQLLAAPLSKLFVGYDAELFAMTEHGFRIYCLAYLINGFNIFGSSFFTALNNGVISAVISFLRTLVFQIIMILLLPTLLGINGIWSAVGIAELMTLCVTITFFIKQRKKYLYI